ncbi:MAG: nucleoside phosphorylase [Syntrophobacteraceae bacterium]
MDIETRSIAQGHQTLSEERANEALIQPRRGKREAPLPGMSIMVFTPQDLQLLCELFPEAPRITHRLFLTDVRVGSINGCSVALAGPLLGAPQAVLVLEKMIALGVTDVVAFGWCGSIHPSVRVGDIVLPTGAISDEGTSAHYPVNTDWPRPSEVILSRLKRELESEAFRLHEGRVWSIDAPYRETRGKVLGLQKEGVLAVDMESSALLTVAHYRSIRLALVLVVSDELFSLKWVHGFKDPQFQTTRQMVAAGVLQAASSIPPG